MIVRLEPITAIVVAVLLGWAWNTATAPGPVCQVQEVHQGKTILVPRPCAEVLPPAK
ncbi:hypothetical protein [Aeromonas veronii]|uniref:hypothetical protein n=1 Tax=Aeromonas veronii TaxID=654 RepID=UPI000A8BA4CB|nr:hypothetical protein [Aeromonas veronii]